MAMNSISYFVSNEFNTGTRFAQIIVEYDEAADMIVYTEDDAKQLEKSNLDKYEKLQADLDSNMAIVLQPGERAVCCFTAKKFKTSHLIKVCDDDLKELGEKFDCRIKPMNKNVGTMAVYGEFIDYGSDKTVLELLGRNAGSSIIKAINAMHNDTVASHNFMNLPNGAETSNAIQEEREERIKQEEADYVQRQKDAVHTTDVSKVMPDDMIRGGIVDSTFVCANDSPTIISAMAFNQKFFIEPKASVAKFNTYADKRYPCKNLPALYEGKPGYALLVKTAFARASIGGLVIPTEVEGMSYQFFEMNTELFDYKPDVLPETIFHDSALQKHLKMTDKIKVNVKGLSNLFGDVVTNNGEEAEKEKEKAAVIVQFFGRFLLNLDYFKITSISAETGWVNAYTVRGTQVLMMACVKTGKERDGILSFIPIKGSLGLAIAGLSVEDYNDLAGYVAKFSV